MKTHRTPIPTPPAVRLTSSVLVGLSIGLLWSRLSFPLALLGGLAAAVLAILIVLLHPYRKKMRAYADVIPTVSQMIPLLIWWVLGMLMPVINLPWWGALIAGLVTGAISFWIFPHVDGTRRLAFV